MPQFLRSRWSIVGLIVLVGISVTYLVARGGGPVDSALVTRVKRGDFTVTVSSTGELRAPKYVKIRGPDNAAQAGEFQFKIATIVPEGTVVKEGDLVATLDRSTIAQRLTDADLALQKADALNQQASLDSTLNLSKAREEMRTAALTLEEQKLARDQSQFEAPSVKRQAEIAYEKAFRALHQDSVDFTTKVAQAVAKMREVGTDLTRQQNKMQIMRDVMEQYSIKAPAPGMVIYVRNWDGKKQAVGSMISSWDPTVATLPDMSKMESVTYVNEIDVRKLAIGQPAILTLDADPTKKLKGTVTQVANSGEQRPNSDAKVFEVVVDIEAPDTTLRPGMTTGNTVQTFATKDVLHVPLEAVLTEQGIPFVYRRVGGKVAKQEVERGVMNDEEVVIARGLAEDDEVLLSPPADRDNLKMVRLPGSKVPSGDSAVEPEAPRAAAHAQEVRRSAAVRDAEAGLSSVPVDTESLALLRGKVLGHLAFALRTAVEAVGQNTLRAGLTSLGILFGVASVIAMLAIGKGAEQEILQQMRLLGSNNVIVTPLVEQKEAQLKDNTSAGKTNKKTFTPGLTYADAQALQDVIPQVEATSAEVVLNTMLTREGRTRSGKLVGVDTSLLPPDESRHCRRAAVQRRPVPARPGRGDHRPRRPHPLLHH